MNDYDFNQLTQSARDSNLAEYFLQSGYTTRRHGAEIYVKEFPGLCVNQNTNKWYNHYEKVGGSNAVDCLVKVCGHDFKQAVYELTGRDISDNSSKDYPQDYKPQYTAPPKKPPTEGEENLQPQALRMPERGENMRRVFAYFCKERKIPSAVVEELAHAKLLYQSAAEIKTIVDGIPQISKPPNAVFVHKNEDGEVIGGEVQGINSFKRYKGVVAGTGDSVFMFTPLTAKDGDSKAAYLFESGIDLMSFYALAAKETLQGVTLISMAGLKPTVPKQLQEQGVNVLSYVDNDDAGRKFEADNDFKRGTDALEKAQIKDWNDALKMSIENPESIKITAPVVAPIAEPTVAETLEPEVQQVSSGRRIKP
jgi:hypothetical protein